MKKRWIITWIVLRSLHVESTDWKKSEKLKQNARSVNARKTSVEASFSAEMSSLDKLIFMVILVR